MKKILLAVAMVLAFASNADAQDWAGPYVGINGGYGWGSDRDTLTPLTANAASFITSGEVPGSLGLNPNGGLGGGQLGYNFQSGQFIYGAEADLDYAAISGTAFGMSPDGDNRTLTAKQRLDMFGTVRGRLGVSFGPIMPYVTGGFAYGIGDLSTAIGRTNGCTGNNCQRGSATAFLPGWTGGAGVEYAFAPHWSLKAEYLYYDLGSVSHLMTDPAFPAAVYSARAPYRGNIARLGLNWHFGAPPPPAPPMAAPMPAAAPAPAPAMARTFLVFFDFDKSNLTPDARRVIDAAAQSYKATGSARIDVSGYTDLAGTQAYNLRLSQRRADAVAGYLEKQGVPKNAMDVKWFGKEHPRVPTPDGVREPQNRRVEIVMP